MKNGTFVFQNRFYDFENGQILSTAIKTQNFTVLQVADSYYLADFSIDSHAQPCALEITFVSHGNLVCATDGVALKVEKNNAYLSFDADMHALSAKNSCRFQTLAVNVHEYSPYREILRSIESRRRKTTDRLCRVNGLGRLFSAVVGEFTALDKPFRTEFFDACIGEILVRLARGEEAEPELVYSQQDLLKSVLHYIDERFLTITSLFELSAAFGYSYNYLCTTFKKTYGTTLRAYLLQKKNDYAKELVKSGKSVTEISEILGYSSPYNFSRSFKTLNGVSPERYKKASDIPTPRY